MGLVPSFVRAHPYIQSQHHRRRINAIRTLAHSALSAKRGLDGGMGRRTSHM